MSLYCTVIYYCWQTYHSLADDLTIYIFETVHFFAGLTKSFVSILLSVTGASEIPMRILNGWFADRKFVSASTQVTVYMLFTGVSAFLCAAISGTAGN